MSEYIFVLGRSTDLCLAEVLNVLKRESISFVVIFKSPEILHISSEEEINPLELIDVLGGTIKIAKVLGTVTEDLIVENITNYLLQTGDKSSKIDFGLSLYGNIGSKDLSHKSLLIKENLEKEGIKSRFFLPDEKKELSSVVVAKQKVNEFILVEENEGRFLAKTLAVQDFEEWGKRDYQRPTVDPHRGMLPPKVARMMINLGYSDKTDKEIILLDPFCGVGTILAEAMVMGMSVFGNDLSKEAVEGTRKNLEWLKNNYGSISKNYEVFQGDATHISEKIKGNLVDLIVTEPYLGPLFETSSPKFQENNLKNIITGLDKLYIGCLREWKNILKTDGKIVIAVPSFKVGEREFFVKKALDTCESLGYTLVGGPYKYFRPQAVVIRNIYILEKK